MKKKTSKKKSVDNKVVFTLEDMDALSFLLRYREADSLMGSVFLNLWEEIDQGPDYNDDTDQDESIEEFGKFEEKVISKFVKKVEKLAKRKVVKPNPF